eukprot:3885216-Pyramimonas_sp.AAC.2
MAASLAGPEARHARGAVARGADVRAELEEHGGGRHPRSEGALPASGARLPPAGPVRARRPAHDLPRRVRRHLLLR